MKPNQNYYEILDVNKNASESEIKKAYKNLIKKWHPDKFSDQNDKNIAVQKFMQIQNAYEQLTGTEITISLQDSKKENIDKSEQEAYQDLDDDKKKKFDNLKKIARGYTEFLNLLVDDGLHNFAKSTEVLAKHPCVNYKSDHIKAASDLLKIISKFGISEKSTSVNLARNKPERQIYEIGNKLFEINKLLESEIKPELAKAKKNIIDAIKNYIAVNFNDRTLRDKDRAASPRRLNDIYEILDIVETVKSIDELDKKITARINDISGAFGKLFVKSELKSKISEALVLNKSIAMQENISEEADGRSFKL